MVEAAGWDRVAGMATSKVMKKVRSEAHHG
jgi:hypothetical protein